MRFQALGVLAVVLGAAAIGCSSSRSRGDGPSPLATRAWTGREPPSSDRAWSAVDFARAQVGKRYCWGGTGPSCFDCSGLVQRAWATAGVRLPRTADAIASDLPEVPIENVRVGDILWWPGHVGLYAGGGQMVEALDHRHGVIRRAVTSPHRAFRPPT